VVTVLDSSVIYAWLDARDVGHDAAVAWHGPANRYATTPLVVAEVDHLVRRLSAGPSREWRRSLAAGAYGVQWWSQAIRTATDVVDQYEDLGVGLADASLVALAAHLGTTEIATFDERHFRAMKPLSGGSAFQLLPMDAG
jgi:predicted nucleic acid-binding protein